MNDEEKEICEELVNRWGYGYIHKVRLNKTNMAINFIVSMDLF